MEEKKKAEHNSEQAHSNLKGVCKGPLQNHKRREDVILEHDD